MKLTHCKMCGCALIKWERLYCKRCANYMRLQRTKSYDMKSYRESKAESRDPIILVKDPSKYPLEPGMKIPIDEHKSMIKLATYTPGTELKRGDERIRIDIVGNKMVEVRI